MDAEVRMVLEQVGTGMLVVAALCFVIGELTGNVSQVDKLWSLVPVIYAWWITAALGFHPRMVLMSLVATVWGVRLTYNFSRHGGYSWRLWSGNEDYRWAHVRQWPVLNTRLGFALFDLIFISVFQNVLLLWIALPVLTVAGTSRELGMWDVTLTALFLGLVVLETVADQAQWNFQAEKKRRIASNEPLDGRYASGFVRDGLWARSRHPNYFAEQAIWLVFYGFTVAANGRFDWTGGGALLLVALFQGSSRLSERIQTDKYPDYPAYQATVPRFFPRLT